MWLYGGASLSELAKTLQHGMVDLFVTCHKFGQRFASASPGTIILWVVVLGAIGEKGTLNITFCALARAKYIYIYTHINIIIIKFKKVTHYS